MQARRIAALEAELVHLEDKFGAARIAGNEPTPSDLDLYGRLANGQRRHCEALGWHRTARDTQKQYAEQNARERAAAVVIEQTTDKEEDA
jgi:hypothetical protein